MHHEVKMVLRFGKKQFNEIEWDVRFIFMIYMHFNLVYKKLDILQLKRIIKNFNHKRILPNNIV